ncbi:MAG: hypothetical protein DME53_04300 [Verrucomicrobia bacterium]|nr:MAG: hypothetical protein DME56_04835 [Verrucomicrobiota bacterium]PYK45891.1 MAG: hypothetical protein DME53_04300 [Verrucomicrobiota bacterium]
MEDEEKVEQDEEKMTAADQEQLDQEPAERVTSTRELAKDLERKPSGKADHPANAALFPENESRDFHKRWTDIQTAFVDEPRQAVERADELVAEVIKRLADSFARERSQLEGQWGRGDNVSTEDLRVALQRYRAFFDRLLNI